MGWGPPTCPQAQLRVSPRSTSRGNEIGLREFQSGGSASQQLASTPPQASFCWDLPPPAQGLSWFLGPVWATTRAPKIPPFTLCQPQLQLTLDGGLGASSGVSLSSAGAGLLGTLVSFPAERGGSGGGGWHRAYWSSE